MRRLVVAILLASVPSSLYILASLSLSASRPATPLFYYWDRVEAVAWLADHTRPTDTVFSSYEMGGYIAAHIGHRVFWGHWCETFYLEGGRRDAVTIFSSATPDAERRALLTKYGISYIFYGPEEEGLGGGYLQIVSFRWLSTTVRLLSRGWLEEIEARGKGATGLDDGGSDGAAEIRGTLLERPGLALGSGRRGGHEGRHLRSGRDSGMVLSPSRHAR